MSFILVDQITQFDSGKSISGLKHISHSEPYLTRSHHSSKAIFIPSLIGEATGQLAAWSVMHALDFKKRPVAGIVSKVNILGEVFVGETLKLEATIDALDSEAVEYHGSAYVGDKKVFEIESAIGPMVAMDEMISQSEVQGQFNQISHADLGNITSKSPLSDNSIQRNPLIMFDRILEMAQKTETIAEKDIDLFASYFPDHFPLKPVLPLTMLLSCKIELVYDYLAHYFPNQLFLIESVQKIKMSQFVIPGEVLQTRMKVKEKEGLMLFQFKSFVSDKRVCVCEVVVKNNH